MTESVGHSDHSTSHDRSPPVLLGIAGSYVALAAIDWLAENTTSPILGAMAIGTLIAQPMLIGVWTALGAGSIVTRLPLAIPCVAAQITVPAYVSPLISAMQREDFIVYLVAGLAIWAASTIVFLVIRRLIGLRIQSVERNAKAGRAEVQFSVRYLLVLITLYAIGLGITTQIRFEPPPPPPPFSFLFGPGFLIAVVAVGGAILFAALLPVMAVPLAILHGRPACRPVRWVIGVWIIITLSIVVFNIDQENPLLTLGFLLVVQATAAAVGAGTALILRYAGLRLAISKVGQK